MYFLICSIMFRSCKVRKRVELKMILYMRKLRLRMPPLETQRKNELKTVIQFKRV